MEKVRVGQTIAQAYGFAIREYPKLLGIVWAPLAVSIAVALMLTPGFIGNHVDPNDQEAMARYSAQMLPLSILILLPIRAMIATGVTEQALGMRAGTTFVYFSVGLSIWRFLASWLLVIVALIVLLVGTAIAGAIIVAIGGIVLGMAVHGASAEIIGLLAAAIFAVVFYGAVIFLIVRLTFFIAPIVVAERKIDLARAWELSHGNFWRLFAILIVIFIPLMVIMVAVTTAMYGPMLFNIFGIFSSAFHGANETLLQQQMQAWGQALRARGLQVWPCDAAFKLLFGTFTYGLIYGASAFAYRQIQTSPAPSLRD